MIKLNPLTSVGLLVSLLATPLLADLPPKQQENGKSLKQQAKNVSHGIADDGKIIDLPYLYAKNYSNEHPHTPKTPGHQYTNLHELHPTTIRLEGAYLSSSTWENWVKGPHLTADWYNERTKLKKEGFTLVGSYLNNTLGNPVGGNAQGVKMNQQFAIAINLDFGKIAGLDGLSFQGAGRWRGGGDIGEFIGATGLLDPTASFGSNGFRLQNLFLRQELWDQRIEIRVGRQTPDQVFSVMPISFVYVNDVLNGGIIGFSENFSFSSGDSSWALTGKLFLDELRESYVMSAVFYMPQDLGNKSNHGLNMTFNSPSSGALIMTEIGYLPHTNPESEEGLPGQYIFGGYSVTGPNIHQVDPNNPSAAIWGLYAGASQMVYREGGPGSHQGLSLWGSFCYAPENIAKLPFALALGAMYEGIIPGRDKDQLALGFWWGYASRDIPTIPGTPAAGNQEMLELTYAFAITPWFYIQPDLQYLFNPAANGTVEDALILGLQTSLNF